MDTFGFIVTIAGNRRSERTLVQLNLALSMQKTPGVVEQYLALLLQKQEIRRIYGTKQGPKNFSTYRETRLVGVQVSLRLVLSICTLNSLNE